LSGGKADTDRYAVVGYPVKHSYSPVIHRLFAEQTGQNLSYELLEATPDEFEVAVRGFKAAGGKGLNVTVPHKEKALELAAHASEAARRAQAANTLDFRDGSITAHNTDGSGLIRDLESNLGFTLAGRSALILGAGGAARGIIAPLIDAGVTSLTVANRTRERAISLRERLSEYADFDVCAFTELDAREPADLLINATSAGVKGEAAPFPPHLFTADTFCYDLSYSLKDTPFVELARKFGAGEAVQGWGMLIEQAADSFEIWRGVRPDTGPILEKMRR
jgi:shikimate dehydrogenase